MVVACPDLPDGRAAELEARARATLLTSDLSATATISCAGDGVKVRVVAGDDSATLELRPAAATLREEALLALDRALAELRARKKLPETRERPTPGSTQETNPEVAPLTPAPSEPTPVGLPPAPTEVDDPAPPARQREISAYLLGESWGTQAAVGGGLGAGVRFDSTWSCGVRAAALRPVSLGEATVIEVQALAEVALTAPALAGLRFGIGIGPSVVFVSPHEGFETPGPTSRNAARLEARLSRPFRFGRVELAPFVGVRAFTAERGVRVAQQTRLVIGGVQPQLGLSLSLTD